MKKKSLVLLMFLAVFVFLYSCTTPTPLQKPNAPTNLSGEYDYQTHKLTLTWSSSGTGVKYRVYKKLSDSDYVLVEQNINTTEFTFDLSEDEWDNLEKVAVSAYNDAGESTKTELSKSQISEKNKPTPPNAPENVSGSYKASTRELKLSWSTVAGEGVKYKVYKKLSGNDYTLVVEELTETATTIILEEGEWDNLEKVAVSAYNDAGESAKAELDKESITVEQEAPNAPESVTGTYEDYSQKLSLSWSEVQGEGIKYKVYKKLKTESDFTLVQENITATTVTLDLPLSEWDNLEKVAVSAYNENGESPKTELPQSSITLLDFAGGNGTEEDPYLIGNARQLQNIGKPEYLNTGKYFKLIDDIDLTGVTWTPIGTYSSNLSTTAFVGVFDGNGKKIRNLTYNDSSKQNVGVFGYIYNATVTNLIIESANITAKQYVGALSGGAKNSTVEKVGVRNSTLRAENSSGNAYVGGLIGDVNADNSSSNAMIIRQCFANNVTVSAPNYDNARAGGLIGRFYANTVETGVIENCYAIGTVNFKSTNSSNIGGLIGLLSTNTSSGGKAKVVNCYAAVAPGTDGASKWKGFIGGDYSPATTSDSGNNYFDKEVAKEETGSLNNNLQTGKTTAEMKSGTPYDETWSTTIWKFVTGQYPTLQWEY